MSGLPYEQQPASVSETAPPSDSGDSVRWEVGGAAPPPRPQRLQEPLRRRRRRRRCGGLTQSPQGGGGDPPPGPAWVTGPAGPVRVAHNTACLV
eukprot:gene23734-biopygen1288